MYFTLTPLPQSSNLGNQIQQNQISLLFVANLYNFGWQLLLRCSVKKNLAFIFSIKHYWENAGNCRHVPVSTVSLTLPPKFYPLLKFCQVKIYIDAFRYSAHHFPRHDLCLSFPEIMPLELFFCHESLSRFLKETLFQYPSPIVCMVEYMVTSVFYCSWDPMKSFKAPFFVSTIFRAHWQIKTVVKIWTMN